MGALRTRLGLTLAATALAVGLVAAAKPADEPGFTPIFNGKDLTGWDGEPEHWSVKDGAITGVTSKDQPLAYNRFLVWRGGKPKNFELKTSFRLIGNNNSGVQYRSKELPKVGPYSEGQSLEGSRILPPCPQCPPWWRVLPIPKTSHRSSPIAAVCVITPADPRRSVS